MSSITLTPQMLAVLDDATVARLQALVAMAAVPVLAPVSERQALMLEGIAAMTASAEEKKARKTLSPEHLAKMKAGREAAALKKQLVAPLEATAPLAPAAEVAVAAEVAAEVSAAVAAPVAVAVAAPAPVPAPVPAPAKESKKGKPTAWADWVKKVMVERKDEITAYKEAAEQKTGASLKWIAANLGKTSPEWIAFKASWAQEDAQPQAPSVSAATSDDEEAVAAPVPVAVAAPVAMAVAAPVAVAVAVPVPVPVPVKKRGPKPMVEMSAEELKAFLEAKKAKKAAASAAADTDMASPDESDNEPIVTPPVAGKKRGPKPLATMTTDERAAHDAKVAERKVAKEAKARAAEAALAMVAQMQAAH